MRLNWIQIKWFFEVLPYALAVRHWLATEQQWQKCMQSSKQPNGALRCIRCLYVCVCVCRRFNNFLYYISSHENDKQKTFQLFYHLMLHHSIYWNWNRNEWNRIESNGEDIERKAPKTKKYRWIKWNKKRYFSHGAHWIQCTNGFHWANWKW